MTNSSDKDHGHNDKSLQLIVEYAKAVLGLVALLLGFSVGFLSTEGVGAWALALYSSWFCLVGTAISCLMIFAKLVSYYKNPESGTDGAIKATNISFFLLGFSLVFLTVYGFGFSGDLLSDSAKDKDVDLTDLLERLVIQLESN